MADIVKYGIVGTGMMGREHIRNIKLLEGARVTAVYDPNSDLAKEAASLADGAAVCANMRELVEQVDALVIVSPNHLHVDQLFEIAQIRHLPILVEKPLFTDPSEAARIKTFEAMYTSPVWVAMEYRYMPPVAKLIEQAQNATGGIQMMSIREHRFPFLPKIGNWNRFNRNTGGTLVEKCCHHFDLMRFAIGAEPIRVMASAAQNVNHLGEIYAGETPDIWDNGYVIVDFANGARGMLELCMFAEGSRYQEEISVVGRDGKLECFVPGPTRFWPKEMGEPPVAKLVVSPRSPMGPREIDVPVDPSLLAAGDHNGSTYYQHQRFLAMVRGEGSIEVGMRDGAQAVAIGLAAQKSAREGIAVDLI